MAAIDSSTTPFKWPGSGNITISDGGANTLNMTLIGSFSYEEPGRTKVEVRERRRHQATPVVLETDDGDVSISISGKVTSLLGSGNVHPYEAFTQSGNASAWTSVGSGDAYQFQIVATATHPDGSTQTATFAYCTLNSISVNFDGEDGQMTFEATLTDYENAPTIA